MQDNASSDGTREILETLGVIVIDDPEIGYWQSRKTTALALLALERGHKWVVPCDADEIWIAPDDRTISDFLCGTPPDVQIVTAQLFNHLPSKIDDASIESPVRRICWRQRAHAPMGKVACRLHPEMVIHAGNHSAWMPGICLSSPGLSIRHFSWRSAEQYRKKIRNGEAAYKATDLPENIGVHWRMFENATDEAVMGHFWQWFCSSDPTVDSTLIYDPAPALLDAEQVEAPLDDVGESRPEI